MKIIKLILEFIIVSIVAIIVCTGTVFLQTLIVLDATIGGAGASTVFVMPLSAFLGPVIYFLLLRKILTLSRFGTLIVLNLIIGLILIFLVHLISGIGFWLIHFITPFIWVLVCLMFRLFFAEYQNEDVNS